MNITCISRSKKMYGNGTGNTDNLEIGKTYTLLDNEIHGWHTLYWVKNVKGSFNSCLFENAPKESEEAVELPATRKGKN